MLTSLSLQAAVVLTSGYGTVTELVQIWVPGRCPSLLDCLFDIAGAMIASGLSGFAQLEISLALLRLSPKLPLMTVHQRLEQVEVSLLANDTRAWDDYVMTHPGAYSYHQTGWKAVIEQSFGHKTQYVLATRGSRIVGVLPLAVMKSVLFGRFLVSLPFLNYGGILADDEQAEQALLTSAQRIAAEEGAECIELRHVVTHGHGLPAKRHKVTMILDLEPNVETQWRRFDAKLRNQIRKAEKSGLRIQVGGQELLEAFYAIFARNMRDLGTPVYGTSFFMAILTNFPSSTKIFVVRLGEKPVAAGLASTFRDTVEMPWAGSLKEYRGLCGNMLLYWEAIKFAIEHGLRNFDFGRSTPQEGTFRFKQQWGGKPTLLAWEYWMNRPGEIPDLTPHNPQYRLAIRIWKHLPVKLATYLGPSIVRNIP